MTITGQNFEVYQGDNKTVIVTVRNQDGSLTNLTGYNAVWCAYRQTPDTIVILKTTTSGITIPDPLSGELHIDLGQTDTAALTTSNYGHQCEIEDSFGNHATVMAGYMRVLKSITHPEF